MNGFQYANHSVSANILWTTANMMGVLFSGAEVAVESLGFLVKAPLKFIHFRVVHKECLFLANSLKP